MSTLHRPRYRYLGALIICLGISLFSAVSAADSKTSIDEINQQTRELLHSLKSYSAEQRDQAIAEADDVLEKLDERISVLHENMVDQWQQMDQAARDNAQATLRALRKQRTQVAEWYGSLKTSSAGAWAQIMQGFSEAYGNLHEAWGKAEQEFNKEK